MTEDFLLCHANIYVGTLLEHLWCLSSIVEDEKRHDDVACHVVETASQEVVNCLVVSLLHLVDGSLIKLNELAYTLLQCLQVVAYLALHHLLDDAKVCTVGDVTDGCNYLQLGGTLVDREDTSVTEQTLALVLHDET